MFLLPQKLPRYPYNASYGNTYIIKIYIQQITTVVLKYYNIIKFAKFLFFESKLLEYIGVIYFDKRIFFQGLLL